MAGKNDWSLLRKEWQRQFGRSWLPNTSPRRLTGIPLENPRERQRLFAHEESLVPEFVAVESHAIDPPRDAAYPGVLRLPPSSLLPSSAVERGGSNACCQPAESFINIGGDRSPPRGHGFTASACPRLLCANQQRHDAQHLPCENGQLQPGPCSLPRHYGLAGS